MGFKSGFDMIFCGMEAAPHLRKTCLFGCVLKTADDPKKIGEEKVSANHPKSEICYPKSEAGRAGANVLS